MIDRFVNTHDLTHFPNNCFTFVSSNMENFTCDWFSCLFYFILIYISIKMEIIGPSLNQLLLFHRFSLQKAHHVKWDPFRFYANFRHIVCVTRTIDFQPIHRILPNSKCYFVFERLWNLWKNRYCLYHSFVWFFVWFMNCIQYMFFRKSSCF